MENSCATGPDAPVRARIGLLILAVVATVALVAIGARHSSMSVLYLAMAAAAAGVLAHLESRRPRLDVRVVVAAIAVVFLVAVVAPPRTSNDLWSYTSYGRMLGLRGVSPYTHVPADFRGDPFLHRVSVIWRHRSSVFGPLWNGWSTLGALIAGNSVLLARLFFQLTAAATASLVLLLVWRRTHSPAALIWLGLQPAVGAVAINGGHSDLVVGAAILLGVIAAAARRPVWAGVALAAAALIKVTAALALLGLGFWLWRRGRPRDAVRAVIAWSTTLLLGWAAFVGDAIHALAGADHTVTPASAWNGLADLVLGHDAGRAWRNPVAPNGFLDGVFVVGAVTVVTVAVVAGWAVARRSTHPGPPVGTTTAAYTLGAQYTFPWYAAWALPCFADSGVEPLGWLVWIQATVMLAALKLSSHPNGTPGDYLLRIPITVVAPPALLVAFVVLALSGRPHTGRPLAERPRWRKLTTS
jgi:hypothetical protein